MTRTLCIDIETHANEPVSVYISDGESGDTTHRHFDDEDFDEWLVDNVRDWIEWMMEGEG